MIKLSQYLQKALEAFNDGRIDEDTYDAMVMNADIFCDDDDDDDDDYFLPPTYAEIEYTTKQLESDPIAIEGAKFDDLNYLHYRER